MRREPNQATRSGGGQAARRLDEADEVFSSGVSEIIDDAEFALGKGSITGVIVKLDGTEDAFLVLDGGTEHRTRKDADLA